MADKIILSGSHKMAKREDNLIPGGHKLTLEEQSKGGKASAEKRRQRKTFAEAFDAWLSSNHKDKSGIKSGTEILAMAMLEKAKAGDTKAFELIRDTVGEKPIDKVATVQIPEEVRSTIESLVEEYEAENGIPDTD